MNYYPFHIGDYASHTRHLTPMGDLAYRRLLDLYYGSEKPLPLDPAECARLIGMREHVQDVSEVLSDFFLKSEAGYTNKRADREIEVYRAKADRARNANKARWKSEPDLKSDADRVPTNNQEPITNKKINTVVRANGSHPPDDSPLVETLPLLDGSQFEVKQSLVAELEPIYPKVDVPATIREMKGWLIGNPNRRKTRSGVKRFITQWLHTEQQKAEAH